MASLFFEIIFNLIGGCCGTNPDYIRRMAEIIKKPKH